ncbi:MAG: hypothetical protein K0R93_2935 [Anaerosolibacter sp.]|jgi:hypothetical protein|nr:hypothetical protein [Anaerosolibacter sp.]
MPISVIVVMIIFLVLAIGGPILIKKQTGNSTT